MEDGIKISELTRLATLNGEGEIPIVNNDETKRINVVDLVYPIGSIYMSVNSTNPSAIFGGTWEQIQDRFLLSAGSTYSAGSTGGEATHTLTETEMPSHTHNIHATIGGGGRINGGYNAPSGSSTYNIPFTLTNDTNYIINGNTGGGQPHNNMPPYLAVYVWKRTA